MSEYKIGVGSWDEDENPKFPEPKKLDQQVETIGDHTIMWFGKHQGKSFAQIPADYFMWLYDQHKCHPKIRAYVEANMDSLKQEAAVKTWNK